MAQPRKYLRVFEHQSIKLGQFVDGHVFEQKDLAAFEKFHGDGSIPYFTLIRDGIRFNEYVGVIQAGNTVIEVLPKADNTPGGTNVKNKWRGILLAMLRAAGIYDIHAPSNSHLKMATNSILDLYFELFTNEIAYLLHTGLIKKYRIKESNAATLKGRLLFNKHIQHNSSHQERFYVSHTTYDQRHHLHGILYKTIRLLQQLNTNLALGSRIGTLLLDFPEMPDLKVSDNTFSRISYNRKTQPYKKAIEISRMLLLHYHPDVSKGGDNILALMFDMNVLWEKFVLASLQELKNKGITVTAQSNRFFWKPATGKRTKIIPDIVINKNGPDCAVLDTKWKNLNGYNPSPDDLRQMYVYHEYYNAKRVALVYPASSSGIRKGTFLPISSGSTQIKECSIIFITVEDTIVQWQKNIRGSIAEWLNSFPDEQLKFRHSPQLE